MPTLKEIKGRISSVKGTLKITAAMKLVSSAKLRKAQKATEAMRPYETQLRHMLDLVQSSAPGGDGFSAATASQSSAPSVRTGPKDGTILTKKADFVGTGPDLGPVRTPDTVRTAIIGIASNSSLCGGFNTNIIAKVRSVRKEGDVVYSIGRKMADAMRKEGFASPADYTALADHPSYGSAAALVDQLAQDLAEGRIGQVLLVYTHFVSTAKQVPTVEVLMSSAESDVFSDNTSETDAIIEPGRKELLSLLEPKLIKLKLYAALLDSAAAEHAARTVAMQTATDNGENLLQELTLQYNKGRQQKITSEILDLAGGQAQE
ncbi:MAG: F0F1 ATP synthase subunit gamma [Bacteroidales bacterium]|nr:F0F1 ATP synthase subunit gamma [Bacteroidales bacterium]